MPLIVQRDVERWTGQLHIDNDHISLQQGRKFNINLEIQQGNDEWALPMPARFIIDQEGIIQYAESKPDYRTRPNPDELIEVLKNI